MGSFRKLLASLLFSSTAVVAQTPPVEPPPRVDIAELLNLDATRAQQVHAIMKASHAKMQAAHEQIGLVTDETSRTVMRAAMEAIRSDTDNQLATVLTPEELDKLHAAIQRRHRIPPGVSG
jgi:Spy/CpxP family protein refolding chaperone